jgi:hypothetical protein
LAQGSGSTGNVSLTSGATLSLGQLTLAWRERASTAATLTISGAGSLINVNSGSPTSGSLVNVGSPTAGTATLNIQTGGTLTVDASTGFSNVDHTGTVNVAGGTFNAAAIANSGALNITSGLVNATSATLNSGGTLGIGLGGLARGSQFGALLATGSVTLGGTLQVSLTSGFVPMPTAAADVSFDILDWTNVSGKFSTLQLPALAAPAGWNTSQLNTMGVLTATLFVPGDVSRDGHVNIADISALGGALADLSKYQSTHGPGGGALTSQQLLQIANLTGDNLANNLDVQGLINYLANNAGALSAPGGDSSVTAVPEPSSLVLLVLGLTTALIRQRCRSVGTLTTGKV